MPDTLGPQQISGQITVTTAGTEIQGSNIDTPNGVYVRALGANTGYMYVGNNGDGTVSNSTGFQLSAGAQIHVNIANLADMWVDASVNGEKVCWLKA
jgi:hypothetical protein